MIEAVRSRMGTPQIPSLGPLLLNTDNAAVRAQRMIKQLIDGRAELGSTPEVDDQHE